MMTLAEIRDWFKSEYMWQDSAYIGKIDKDREIAVCFYGASSSQSPIKTIGGKQNRSYSVKRVSVLLRYGTNAAVAEAQAQRIYDFFDEKETEINGKSVFIVSVYAEPIALGTDDNGIYEYSLYYDFYERK